MRKNPKSSELSQTWLSERRRGHKDMKKSWNVEFQLFCNWTKLTWDEVPQEKSQA